MKSIKKQFIVLILALVLIPIAIVDLSYYFLASDAIKSQVKNNNKVIANSVSKDVQSFVQKAYSVSEEIVNNNDVKSLVPDKQKSVLVSSINRNKYFDLFYIQDTKGMQTARNSGKLADRSKRWWFIKIIKDKEPFVTKSYYSVSNNSTVCSIILPIYDQAKKLISVFGADLKLDSLQSLVEKSNTQKGSYTYIIDGDGTVIAHPDKNQVAQMYNYKTKKKTVMLKDASGKVMMNSDGSQKTKQVDIKVPEKLGNSVANALKGESGNIEYVDNDGKNQMCVYNSISIPGSSDKWAVITVQDKSVALQPIKNIQYINITILVIVVVLIILITLYSVQSLTNPIIKLKALMEKASQGDLTVHSYYNSKNEIGDLSNSFNSMIDDMKKLINKISETSGKVTLSSSSLVSVANENVKAIEEIAGTITNIAEGAQDQAVGAENGLNAANNLSNELEKMMSDVERMMASTEETVNSNNRGVKVIDKLEGESNKNNEVIKKVAKVINLLNDKANSIGEIVETISAISEQTNLLALNAAIEAARAGEHGKGFSVVAEEVRKLSEGTSNASSKVKEILDTIQNDVAEASEAINYANSVADDQNAAVKDTKLIFSDIASSVNNVIIKVKNISKSIENVDTSRNEVLDVLNKAAEMATNLSSSSEEVSAATQQQTASMNEMNNFALQLKDVSNNLNDEIKAFKIAK
ncbi:methyl-accepting chemotaxis protein [Clostridium neuense]|uniref:Methyl-accepting chemotaxis protein n=1 Tax=Clostridium neuense TaxID=1728934 RepID=A0ABW8TLS0_9CLOT